MPTRSRRDRPDDSARHDPPILVANDSHYPEALSSDGGGRSMPPRGATTLGAVGARVVGEILARSEAMKPPVRPSGVRGFADSPGYHCSVNALSTDVVGASTPLVLQGRHPPDMCMELSPKP